MGKKQKKPGKGKEKTERKTAKGEEKRARREARKVGEEDDIDAILFTINPLKDTKLILYGGEFYNGNKTIVYGDLYRCHVALDDTRKPKPTACCVKLANMLKKVGCQGR